MGESETLVAALNGFSDAYREALRAAMLDRLGVTSQGGEADITLVNAAFRALAEGAKEAGDRLRWEPFFFDWFGGPASQARAISGPRGDLYETEPFHAFRTALEGFEADRPQRLGNPYFGRTEPEMLIEAVEAIWAPIAEADDWSALDAKLAGIETARQAYGL